MLLDTSGLVSVFDAGDPHHAEARGLVRSAPVLLTHSYVLAEFVALCHARRLNRARALAFAGDILTNTDVEVVWVARPLHSAALAFLRARPDKSYSLSDAVSFLLMRDWSLRDALTTDHHFDQEGFARLLKP